MSEEYIWRINDDGTDAKIQKVVRCKDCKYWHDWSNMSWYDEEQGYYCEYSGRAYWTAEDFCSRGVKR